MVDLDDNRLETAVSFGATYKVNSSDPEKEIKEVYDLTDGRGVGCYRSCWYSCNI